MFNTIVPSKLVVLKVWTDLCAAGSWIPSRRVVRVGSNISSSLTHNTGAPQGCVLSPLLYSLYTHDCVATHSSNVIVKFADDRTVVGLITVMMNWLTEKRCTPWLTGATTSVIPRSWWWISGDGPVSTPTSPSTGLQWSGSTAVAETSPRTSPGLFAHGQ